MLVTDQCHNSLTFVTTKLRLQHIEFKLATGIQDAKKSNMVFVKELLQAPIFMRRIKSEDVQTIRYKKYPTLQSS
uniref:Uncharacterized protein n=1 Tax=Rhizophora mucronata TaxID=61149 RepID=A0A2P2PPG1_RHIMU